MRSDLTRQVLIAFVATFVVLSGLLFGLRSHDDKVERLGRCLVQLESGVEHPGACEPFTERRPGP